MDRDSLRALQAPVREKYKSDATAAWTEVSAKGDFNEPGITCSVETWAGPVLAGLHPATGGDGTHACSGDMLVQALLACAGVTLRSVATAMNLDLGRVELTAESHFDARGTLGMDRTIDVGIAPATVTVTIDADLDDTTRARLASSTERYCVVGQSLKHAPRINVVTRRD